LRLIVLLPPFLLVKVFNWGVFDATSSSGVSSFISAASAVSFFVSAASGASSVDSFFLRLSSFDSLTKISTYGLSKSFPHFRSFVNLSVGIPKSCKIICNNPELFTTVDKV